MEIHGNGFRIDLGPVLYHSTSLKVFGRSDHALVLLLVTPKQAQAIKTFLVSTEEGRAEFEVSDHVISVVCQGDTILLSVNSYFPVTNACFSKADFLSVLDNVRSLKSELS